MPQKLFIRSCPGNSSRSVSFEHKLSFKLPELCTLKAESFHLHVYCLLKLLSFGNLWKLFLSALHPFFLQLGAAHVFRLVNSHWQTSDGHVTENETSLKQNPCNFSYYSQHPVLPLTSYEQTQKIDGLKKIILFMKFKFYFVVCPFKQTQYREVDSTKIKNKK